MSGIILPVPEKLLQYELGRTPPQVLLDNSGPNNGILYQGWAAPNTAQTSPGWVITSYRYDTNNLVSDYSTLTGVIWSLRTTYQFP
jgi:hypothetical protein